MLLDLSHLFVREFECTDETTLSISQCEIGDVGCVVWDAAIVLASYLECASFKSHTDLSACTVLELGAGTGLVGIQAASLGAHCVITDLSEFIPLIALNIRNNAGLIRGTAEARTLVWGEKTELFTCPDVILLADCIYYGESITPLVRTLESLSTLSTKIFCCYEERTTGNKPELQKLFFKMVRESFEVEEVPLEDQHPLYRSEDIHLMKFVKKS